jgi:uncharacterized protein YndB with AHSA1/START domain
MPTAQRTITINRSPEDVFTFFADPENDPKWRGTDHVKAISLVGEMRQGARVHQKLGVGPFGAPVKADMDVVTYEPPKALAFQVTTGPLRPRVDFTFVPDPQGTAVTFAINAPLAGLKKLLMGSMAQKNLDHATAALDEAKRLLEI